MKAITIHGLDQDLSLAISTAAAKRGESLNKTLKALIREAIGLRGQGAAPAKWADFSDFCGVWSAKDLEVFERATAGTRHVDAEDWR